MNKICLNNSLLSEVPSSGSGTLILPVYNKSQRWNPHLLDIYGMWICRKGFRCKDAKVHSVVTCAVPGRVEHDTGLKRAPKRLPFSLSHLKDVSYLTGMSVSWRVKKGHTEKHCKLPLGHRMCSSELCGLAPTKNYQFKGCWKCWPIGSNRSTENSEGPMLGWPRGIMPQECD